MSSMVLGLSLISRETLVNWEKIVCCEIVYIQENKRIERNVGKNCIANTFCDSLLLLLCSVYVRESFRVTFCTGWPHGHYLYLNNTKRKKKKNSNNNKKNVI